ncbi:MAG: Chemotaxis protein methyltransferase CheR [Myxococcaceae bacterium]|nr:Chemotaxis protein methyltransferase CheR [Myxococcaceae bacterium]
MALDKLLTEKRDAIVRRFVADLQMQDVPPSGTSRSNVVDHIPFFLDEVIRELRGHEPVRDTADASDVSSTARRHGEQRWELGFDIDALVREYGILRHCILMEAREANIAMSIDDFDKLAKCLNVGIAEAVTAYSAHRNAEGERQHEELAFLAEAGRVLASSLDWQATLTRLVRVVIPRLADWCAIHLADGDLANEIRIAHVDPSKTELVREIYATIAWPTGQTFGTLRTDASNASDPSNAPDALGTTSSIIVPLRVQRATFGAILLAYSDSGRRHSPDDVLLAEDLASRAAVAIENAHLYELANRERARVEAATRAKDEFVAMLSHELRTPLNAILGWTRLVRHGALAPEKHPHAMEVIERNAEAQNQLVGDLLDVSKVISGTVRINPAQMDLRDVVEMAVEGMRPAADAKRVTIDTDLDHDSTLLRGDADRLQQVAWNLLTNAVKFTPKGGRVQITLRRVESDLELVVEDTGIGIAPEFLPHMFDNFRQSDQSTTRSHGGLGVGLAIAKHLVILHGGTLEGSSDGLGHGSRFTVRLPISPVVSSTVGVKRAPAVRSDDRTAIPEGLSGLTVLVVDDETDARELLQILLESCGIVVRIAKSAQAALDELERCTPDVIISDIGMPHEDGYSLIEKIRASASEVTRRIPAIALTAYAMAEDRNRALLAGFNLHATKPADPGVLITMVADLAGRRAAT